MLLSNSLEAGTARTFLKFFLFYFFFLLMYCCELSLTPKIIYACGEQENTNNDAVFPTVICAETGRQAANNSRQETFICMLSNLEKNTNEGYKGIVGVCKKSWELSLIVRRGGGGQGGGVRHITSHQLVQQLLMNAAERWGRSINTPNRPILSIL